jgi:multidrug resistance efflux pump
MYLVCSIALSVMAQDPAAPVGVPPEIGPVQKIVSISGTFAPANATEIRVDLEGSLPLTVLKSVPHGTFVRAGDVLVEFDAASAKEQLVQQEFALAMQRMTLEEAEREQRIAEAKAPLEAESAELTKRRADEDFAFFMEREFPMSEIANEQSLKSMKDYLDYNAEELRQLEKMYKADDLTEESEEIVLRRAKDDLERSKFSFEQSKLNHERTTRMGLPRSKVNEQTSHRLAEIAFEQFKSLQPLIQEKRHAGLKKQRMEMEKAERELEKFKRDMKQLRIEAPHDGIVYFGKGTEGKFANIAEMTAKLRPHGAVAEHEVLMTLVRPGSLAFSGTVSEADLPFTMTGTSATITPTAFPHMRIDSKIQTVAEVPGADGTFAVRVELQVDAPKKVVAGMTGKTRWVAYFNAKALTVPIRFVHQDAEEGDAHFVHVLGADGKGEKRWVEVGIVAGDRTEILNGLSVDDKLVESPSDKK